MAKAQERKPPWLHRMCTLGAGAKLADTRCDGCGRYVCRCRDGVWEDWDPGVVTGPDITVAVIADRPLTRIVRHPGGTIGLQDVNGAHGLDPHSEYLAAHRCGLAPVSRTPFAPRADTRRTPAMRWPRTITYPSTRSSDPWAADMERTHE